jgi:IS605 OrfB family transposase
MEAHRETYFKVREVFPDLPANLVQAARTDALAKIRSSQKAGHKTTESPKLKNVTLRYDTRTAKIRGNEIGLAVCGGKRIKVTFESYPLIEEYRNRYRMLSPGIFYRNGQFWATLPFEVPESQLGKHVTGVDVGQRNLAATSEGRIYKNRIFNGLKRKTRFLKRELQKRGTKNARRKLRNLRFKERRQSDHAIHCLSKQILQETKASVLAVEKLKFSKGGKQGRRSKNRNRRRYAVPVSKLITFLTYKASKFGKKVVSVSPYMTSQDDCRGLAKGQREHGRYIGVDGKILNADVNAACNIAWKAKEWYQLNNPLVPKGYERQALVTEPTTCKPLNCASHSLVSCNSLAS